LGLGGGMHSTAALFYFELFPIKYNDDLYRTSSLFVRAAADGGAIIKW